MKTLSDNAIGMEGAAKLSEKLQKLQNLTSLDLNME